MSSDIVAVVVIALMILAGFFVGRFSKHCFKIELCEMCQHEIQENKMVIYRDGDREYAHHVKCWEKSKVGR